MKLLPTKSFQKDYEKLPQHIQKQTGGFSNGLVEEVCKLVEVYFKKNQALDFMHFWYETSRR